MYGFHAGFSFAATRDRGLLASLNQRKLGVWIGLEHTDHSLVDSAAAEWLGLFKHKSLGRNERYNMDYHRLLDLLQKHLRR